MRRVKFCSNLNLLILSSSWVHLANPDVLSMTAFQIGCTPLANDNIKGGNDEYNILCKPFNSVIKESLSKRHPEYKF